MGFLWRISNRCDLEGVGGEKADGRWHTASHGKRIIYLSEHLALALVEVVANLRGDPSLLPERYQLMKLALTEKLSTESLQLDSLSDVWRDNPVETRTIGDAWLARRSSALLVVPSVPAPESFNYLLNPLHVDSKQLQIEWCRWIKYDGRLFRVPITC